jgi:hypothetical protein
MLNLVETPNMSLVDTVNKIEKLEIEIEKITKRLRQLEHQFIIKDNYIPFNNGCKL